MKHLFHIYFTFSQANLNKFTSTILQPFKGQPGQAGIRKRQEMMGLGIVMASAGPCANNLHRHLITQMLFLMPMSNEAMKAPM